MNLPSTPFVAVVLQREDDPRVRLDAAFVPTAIDLVRATARAAHRIEPGMPLVAVLPDGGIRRADLDTLRAMDGIQITPGITAPEVTAAAVAVVTLNDSRAVTGLLAGTPVVHCGRAFWARPGVAIASCVDRLEVDLPRAVQTRSEPDGGRSRREFLTWLLQEGHVWCSPSMPDQKRHRRSGRRHRRRDPTPLAWTTHGLPQRAGVASIRAVARASTKQSLRARCTAPHA